MSEKINTSSDPVRPPETHSSEDQEKKSNITEIRDAWSRYYRKHRNKVVYTALGFLIAASFLLIGFWGTLLLIIFIVLGMIYGGFKDGDKKAVDIVANLVNRLD